MIKKGNTSSGIAALGNTVLAIIKAIAASISGSGTMFASAMHSVADAINQGFVFIGSVLAEKKPTKKFPTGFGRVINLFCMVAVIVVTVMAYETILKGFKLLKHPEDSTNFLLNFIVLLIAVLIDGSILFKAMKEIVKETKADRTGTSLIAAAFKNARRAAPPTRLVFYEDIVATLGALLALIAVIFANFSDFNLLDGIATILIGFLMVGVAYKVGYDNMVGLIGVAAPQDVEEKVSGLILSDRDVTDISRLRILQEGRTYHVEANIELRKGMTLEEATQSKTRIAAKLMSDTDISDVVLGVIEDDGVRLWNPKYDLE
ncbi:cation diffusion facilitator family transporter [Paenibacillus lemnae]|nr:cation diffusion facilitator family transporter [Paenibacillus lemnae]